MAPSSPRSGPRYRQALFICLVLVMSTVAMSCADTQDPQDGAAPTPTGPVDGFAKIDREFGRMAEEDSFSGAVLVEHEGNVVFQDAYGYADRQNRIPNTTAMRFNIASVAKTFTGAAIAQLVERGALRFHDPIGDHVPRLPASIGRLTIHQLLTHTSGLHDYFRHPSYPEIAPRLTSVSAYRPLIVSDRPEGRPGSRFLYSNSGYILLGMAIEEVTGLDFYDYVEKNIFDPAGMVSTGYFDRDAKVPPRAIGYTASGGQLRPSTATLPPRGSPAGGAYSTVGDMLRFATALSDDQLLDPRFTDIMLSPKVEAPGGRYGYGFSFRKGHSGEGSTIWHNGGAPGVGAEFAMNPRLGYVVIILSNFDYPRIAPAIDLVMNELQIP